MSQEESLSVNWRLIAALGFLSLLVLGFPVANLVLGGNYLELGLPLDVVAYSRFVNAIGSLILTLSLVFLYYQQTRTQEKQEEWMEAEHTPDVSVDRWEVDKNVVELDLANPGNGAAKDLRVGVEIESVYGGYAGRRTTSVAGRWDLFGADVTSRVIESLSRRRSLSRREILRHLRYRSPGLPRRSAIAGGRTKVV